MRELGAEFWENNTSPERKKVQEVLERSVTFEKLSRCVGRLNVLLLPFLAASSDVSLKGVQLDAERIGMSKESMTAHELDKSDAVFHDAAAALRLDEVLRKNYGSERIEIIAQELERFSARKTYEILARHSGIPVEELVQMQNLEQITVYSQEEIRLFAGMGDVDDALPSTAINAAGLTYPEKGRILFNITELAVGHGDGPVDLGVAQRIRQNTNDTIYHEFLHLFYQYDGESTEAERLMYEGTVDAFSYRVLMDLGLFPENPEGQLGTPGYISGPTVAGKLLIEMTGGPESTVPWQTFLLGFSSFRLVVDEKYGEGSYGKVIATNPRIPLEDVHFQRRDQLVALYKKYTELSALNQMIAIIPENDRDTLLEQIRVNYPDTMAVAHVNSDQGNAVMVYSDAWVAPIEYSNNEYIHPLIPHALFSGKTSAGTKDVILRMANAPSNTPYLAFVADQYDDLLTIRAMFPFSPWDSDRTQQDFETIASALSTSKFNVAE